MSTRPITKGNFAALEASPGWEVEDDGYGMLSSVVTFKGDKDAEMPALLSAHPGDERLQLYKSKYRLIGGRAKEVTGYYVGIASGTSSKIQWFPDVSSTTNKIQTHPNFSEKKFKHVPEPLFKLGWESQNGRFGDGGAAKQYGLTGIENYISSEVSVSGIFYTSDKSYVQKWMDGNNKTFQALPDTESLVLPNTFTPISQYHDRFGLLVGVNYEMFGHLYKVTFQVRTASGGWHSFIYDRAPTK